MIDAAKNTSASHYIHRLGLGDDPFAAHFQNDYFYSGGMRQQLLEQLLHYCRFGEQVVVLTGSTGSGTSTILEMLLSGLYDQMDCCRVNAEEMLSPDQLLLSLAEQLDFSPPGSIVDLLNDLRHCADHDQDVEPVLIAVDQAHYLSVEGYELLMHLSHSEPGLVHLLFVGEYQVEQLAKLGGFDEADLQLLELEALTEFETAGFLMGLLCSVGYAGEPPLSADQLSVLHQQSGGNLVEIKRVAPELLGLDAGQADGSGFSIPVTHMAVVGVLALLLLLSWFFPGSEQPDELSQSAGASGQRVSEQIALDIDSGDRKAMTAADALDKSIANLPASQPAVAATAVVKERPLLAQAAAEATGSEAIASAVTAKTTSSQAAPAAPNKAPLASPPPTKPPVPSVEPAKPVVEKAVAAKVAVVPAKLPTVPKAPVSAPPTSVSSNENISPREQRLLKLTASHYMLQLLGSVDEQRTREFVKQYIGRFALTYFETQRNGAPWFVVVAGPYDDREAAKAAANMLPDKLQKQKPWTRSVASVQADIRANQKR